MQLQTYTASQIVADINSHIVKSGSKSYTEWYCGITSDIEQRMFTDHNVQKQGAWWIHRRGATDDEARNAEITMHDKGCAGSHGGGDESSVFVYAYKITPTTRE